MIKRIDLESIALIFVLLTIGIGGVTFNIGYGNIIVMLCIVVATSTKMNKLWGNNIIGVLGIIYISYKVFYKISNYNEGTLINAEIVILCFTILMMFAYIIYDTIGMIFVKKRYKI